MTPCDLVVIGSGFGGSVCALRAAAAGRRVVVLERGPRMTEDRFGAMADGRAPILRAGNGSGPVERSAVRGLHVVVGNAVGGSSQVYTGVTIPAPAEIFDARWPADVTFSSMLPYYERVRSMIAPTPIPCDLPRTIALEAAGRRMGVSAERLALAMDWPTAETHSGPAVHAINGAARNRVPDAESCRRLLTRAPEPRDLRSEMVTWLRGGPAARKRTLDRTYLAKAEAAGAEVRSLCEATCIEPTASGYSVRYLRRQSGLEYEQSVRARRVVLAAGAVNTVRMLYACRDVFGALPNVSRRLGERFFTNGDLGALLVGPADVPRRDSGPPVTAWLDCWASDRLYLMEIGLLPALPRVARGLLEAVGLCLPRRGTRRSRPGDRSELPWIIGVMGFDDRPGRLTLASNGQLVYTPGPRAGPSTQVHPPYTERALTRLRQLAEATGAALVLPPPTMIESQPATVHPLGGAVMADGPDRGVTDGRGEVFGHPGLFIADGAIVPTPTGRAPSMTIAALAERIIERMMDAW